MDKASQLQAQAMLNTAIAQRNQAMDQVVSISAVLASAQEENTALKAKIAELEKPDAAEPPPA